MNRTPLVRQARRNTPRVAQKCEWWQTHAAEGRKVTRLFYPRPKRSEIFPLSSDVANRIRKLVEHGYEADELTDWFRLNEKPPQKPPTFSRVNTSTTEASKTFEYIKAVYGQRCVYCGKKKPLTKDHIISLMKGGKDNMANIVPACWSCNSRKHTKSLEDLAGVETLQYHIFK